MLQAVPMETQVLSRALLALIGVLRELSLKELCPEKYEGQEARKCRKWLSILQQIHDVPADLALGLQMQCYPDRTS
jgi:hypothetical protein